MVLSRAADWTDLGGTARGIVRSAIGAGWEVVATYCHGWAPGRDWSPGRAVERVMVTATRGEDTVFLIWWDSRYQCGWHNDGAELRAIGAKAARTLVGS